MSNYTADEVERMADWVYSNGRSTGNAVPMMREFERRLRQEEEENRRNPVTDPRPGDRFEIGTVTFMFDGDGKVATTGNKKEWLRWCEQERATIIPRREVQR